MHYTTQGLTCNAMLKFKQNESDEDSELEFLTDIDMLLFVEKGIIGDISQYSHRFVKASNKFMGDKYNFDEQESFLMYLDCNNLYRSTMQAHSAYGSFKWVEKRDKKEFWYVPDDSLIGFFLECTIEYPKHLHDSRLDLPLLPEYPSTPCKKTNKLTKVTEFFQG